MTQTSTDGWSQILHELQQRAKEADQQKTEEANAQALEEQATEDADNKTKAFKQHRGAVKYILSRYQKPDLANIRTLHVIEVPSAHDDQQHNNSAVVQVKEIDCSEEEMSQRKAIIEGNRHAFKKQQTKYQQNLCEGLQHTILKGVPQTMGTDIRVSLDTPSTSKENKNVNWYALLKRDSTTYPLLDVLQKMPMKNASFKTKLSEILKNHLQKHRDNTFFNIPAFESIKIRMKIQNPPVSKQTLPPAPIYKDVDLPCKTRVSELSKCDVHTSAQARAASRLNLPKNVLMVDKQCQDIHEAIRTNDATKEEHGLWLELGTAASPNANSYKTRKFALLKQQDGHFTPFGDVVERYLNSNPSINPKLHEALALEENQFADAEEEDVSTRARAALQEKITVWIASTPHQLFEWNVSSKTPAPTNRAYFSLSSQLTALAMEQTSGAGTWSFVDSVIVGTFSAQGKFVLTYPSGNRFLHMATHLTTSNQQMATAFGAFCVYYQLENNREEFLKIIQASGMAETLNSALNDWYLKTDGWISPPGENIRSKQKGIGTRVSRTFNSIIQGRVFRYNYWDLLRVVAVSAGPTLHIVDNRSPWSIFDSDDDLVLEVVGSPDISYVCVHPKNSLINDADNYWYVLSIFNKAAKVFRTPVSHWTTYFNEFIQKFFKEVDPEQVQKILEMEEHARIHT